MIRRFIVVLGLALFPLVSMADRLSLKAGAPEVYRVKKVTRCGISREARRGVSSLDKQERQRWKLIVPVGSQGLVRKKRLQNE